MVRIWTAAILTGMRASAAPRIVCGVLVWYSGAKPARQTRRVCTDCGREPGNGSV